jgi:glycosyltransferase involved in cell wall biosynthesis
MFCSTIIPTIGRPTLSRAINSVLDQDFVQGDFEVVVVNDSGSPLPSASWQTSERVKIIHTQHCERSIARNTGAAAARGAYLHFLDDDDWMLPGALGEFWHLAQVDPANWLYGGTQLVDRQGQPILQLRHNIRGNGFIQVMAGEWIPLQASLIKTAEFFDVGGFNPLISGPEDNDILRKVALKSDFAPLNSLVACVEWGAEGSTTNLSTHAEMSRWAREKILNEPGCFSRMRSSATSSYWHGRIVRAYLTSFVWNLQHRQLFTAFSRGGFTWIGLALASRHILSPAFWRAVKAGHASEAFREGSSRTSQGSVESQL